MKKPSKQEQKFLDAIAETAKDHKIAAENFVVVKKQDLEKVLPKPEKAAAAEICILWGHNPATGEPICLQWG